MVMVLKVQGLLLLTFFSTEYFKFKFRSKPFIKAEFSNSKKVITYSTHHFAPGFYPGTGGLDTQHAGHVVNVPFKEHIGDDDWVSLNRQMIGKLVNVYNPDVFVVLAGADSLYNDDHKALKVTQPGYLKLMAYIQSLNRRMLVLGGGGYNEPAWGFLCYSFIEYLYTYARNNYGKPVNQLQRNCGL